MPLYEYRCSACGQRFEVLQRMGEGAEGVDCPRCGERAAEKLLSTFAASTASAGSAAGPACGGGGGGCGSGSGFT
jgi:putative FmdB family regulatory protein